MHDFPEKEHEEKREMSTDDRKFMQIASSSFTLKDGHYHLPLPLRDRTVLMPNNYQMAEQRDTMKYEKAPPEDLQQVNSKVWYISHHGVYHKR